MQRYIKIYICYLEQGYNYQSSCIFNQAFLKFPRNNAIFVSRYNITPKNKNKMENKKSECSIKYATRHVGEDTGKSITSSDDASHKKIHKTDDADSDRILCQAHGCSIRNKEQLEQSEICGCFSCCRIFRRQK